MKKVIYKRKSTYLILFTGILLFVGFSFSQKELFNVENNLQSYFIPVLVGLFASIIVSILYHNIQLKNEKEKIFFLNLIEILSTTLDERDTYTNGHSNRVTSNSLQLGRIMKLNTDEMELLRWSGILHDIGKIGISDEILLKPGKFSEEEYNIIKEHPSKGARILAQSSDPKVKEIILIILHHHERIDGKGYPGGLVGEKIPKLSRIIAIADSFDAMVSDRPYRKGMKINEAIEQIKDGSGTQFDSEMAKYFITHIENHY